MAGRPKRKSVVESYCESDESILSSAPPTPSTPMIIDKQSWNGFVEVESEPSFFNIMLKNFGVEGVKVQEVISLDEETLQYLPRPVYGLIFLFKYREDDPEKQEESCPTGVWFANQTIDNACASIALLNIVNNINGIELGENIQAFKDFTRDLTPALRGDAIANFKFVMDIHNSFARQVDILSADLEMKEHVASREKGKKAAESSDEDDDCFHFIAFVPVDGKVWKLDGLERQPQNLGDVQNEDWVLQVKPELEARMAQSAEGQTEFSILGLVKAPLDGLVLSLAENVKNVIAVTSRLDSLKPDWKDFINTGKTSTSDMPNRGVVTGADPVHFLTQELIDDAKVAPAIREAVLDGVISDGAIVNTETSDSIPSTDAVGGLVRCLQDLVDQQITLRNSIVEEKLSNEFDRLRAASRRHDWTPAVQCLVKILSEKGELRKVLGDETERSESSYEAN